MRAFLAVPHYVGSGKSKDRNAKALEDAVAPSIIARLIGRPLMELMTVSFDHYDGPMLVKARNKYREVHVTVWGLVAFRIDLAQCGSMIAWY